MNQIIINQTQHDPLVRVCFAITIGWMTVIQLTSSCVFHFKAALSIFGMVGGPLLGLFCLGIFFPCANSIVSSFFFPTINSSNFYRSLFAPQDKKIIKKLIVTFYITILSFFLTITSCFFYCFFFSCV